MSLWVDFKGQFTALSTTAGAADFFATIDDVPYDHNWAVDLDALAGLFILRPQGCDDGTPTRRWSIEEDELRRLLAHACLHGVFFDGEVAWIHEEYGDGDCDNGGRLVVRDGLLDVKRLSPFGPGASWRYSQREARRILGLLPLPEN